MTLIMLWREPQADRLWLLSDSRLSVPGDDGGRIRHTDRGAKILEAMVTLWEPPSDASKILATRRLGFAYTGSSLIALQAYSAVLPLWTRLSPIEGSRDLPTMGECAEHLSKFVHAYSRDVGGAGYDCTCQCFLIGYDDSATTIEAWKVETDAIANITVQQLAIIPGDMNLFGSGRRQAKKVLAARPARGWGQEPLQIMRRHLKADAQIDVGGGVQIGMATRDGFELCFDAEPFTAGVSRAGEPLVALKYRGFNFSEISRVGPTFSTLRGVSNLGGGKPTDTPERSRVIR